MKKLLLSAALLASVLAARADLAAVAPAKAASYVEALYPLQQVLAESWVIAEGFVESHDAQKKIAAIKVGKSLKGKCTYDVVRITYGGGQFWHPEGIPKHFVKDAPVLIFYNEARQAEVYLNRFFFQLYGDAGAPPDKAWWTMTHIEIRMNRTFNGPVKELTDTVQKCLAGKMKPPAPSAKIPPIDLKDAKALPAFGEPLDESKLPLPFRKYDPNARVDAAPVAVNPEGFLSRWLVLGPIPIGPLAADMNAAFNKEWIPNQKTVQPQQKNKVKVGDFELSWDVWDLSDFYVDLGSTENSISFVLTYVISETDIKDAVLLTGSDDGATWWLNGQEVQRVLEGRAVGKDQDRTQKPLALKKGVNVLLGAIINGSGPTGACARFVDKANQPLLKLKSGAEQPKP
jgi:hypothetical protein